MGIQDKVDREINLVEMFWQILFNWRWLTCFGIVFGIFFSGMKYVRDTRAYRMDQNMDIAQKESELPEDEMQQVLNARNLAARIDEYEDYLSSSVLMQINPYEKQVVELQYYVDSDYTFNYTQESQNDYTNDLIALYYNYIMSGEMSNEVLKEAKLSITQANFSELWSVLQTGNSISIKIVCTEEEKMDVVAEIVKAQLRKKEVEFQKVGSHKLKLLGESKNIVVDNSLIDRKSAISNNIVTFNTQLNALKANMTEQQLSLLNKEQEKTEDESVSEELANSGFSFKYMIVGVATGILLVCAWIACKMLFSTKLQVSEEIRTLYNMRILGEVAVQSPKRRFLSAIDEKFLALKNRRKKKLSLEQQIKIISANITLSCKQKDIDCIYMTGSEYNKIDTVILNMLREKLFEQNIQVKEGDDIFYDPESLKRGTEVGTILFVEQIGQSIYDEISNELNIAKEQNNYILGVVVLI